MAVLLRRSRGIRLPGMQAIRVLLAPSPIDSRSSPAVGREGCGRAVKSDTIGVTRHPFLLLVVMLGVVPLLTLPPDLHSSCDFSLSHFVSRLDRIDESSKRIFFLTSNQNWLY
jgi:hypothetical protein